MRQGFIAALIAAAALALPSGALAGPAGAGVSAHNVEHLATLPAPAAVSANFKTVGGTPYMFVSTLSGLYVYDISDPAAPAPAGALPLPHFQNEDVSLGGDRLLISTDGAAGGVLLVVNIADPTKPRVERAIKMELIGEGHTATCIDERCRWVWVAGDQINSSIAVLDLDRPAQAGVADLDARFAGFGFTPKPAVLVGDIKSSQDYPLPEFAIVTHDVHVDDRGVAWVAGGGGTVAFDVSDYGAPGSDPLKPDIVARTGDAAANDGDAFDNPLITGQEPDPENARDTVNDFIHHNALRPRGGDVALISEEDLYNRRTTTTPGGCETQGSFQTWRIGPDGAMSNLDSWKTEFNELLADQDQDPWEGDLVPTSGMCSAHYFDERDGLVAVAWYEQGMRVLDVSDPERIRQVGYWIPPGDASWSAYWSPTGEDIAYVLQNKRGVDVVRVGAEPGSSAAVSASADAVARGARGSSGGRAHPAFGWMCRIGR